jgi:hypothetical protein
MKGGFKMLANQTVEKIDGNRIKELERFTRRLYIYRQKDRPQDERGNGKGRGYLKNEIIN